MTQLRQRIRTQWNRSDTTLFASTGAGFALLLANCRWESVQVVYLAAALPLLLLTLRARTGDRTVARALIFGGLVGGLWPAGEWFVVTYFGWWGSYVAEGIRIIETPLYCMAIGWVASTYCFYQGARATEIGYGRIVSGCVSGAAALVLGVAGENMFVAARMWVYDASDFDWGRVPAFVPISYGLAYATIPVTQRLRVVPRALIFTTITLVVSVGLGVATGFFPRAEGRFNRAAAPEHPEIHKAFLQDRTGWSPLHEAVLDHRTREVRRLVEQGADLDAKTPGSLWTPIDIAALYNKADLLAYLVEAWEARHGIAYDYDPLLFRSVIHGNYDTSKYLLDRGGNPDTKSFEFEPQLRVAATHAHYRVMELLIEYGADVNAAAASGLTALHGAAERGVDGVALLLRHGADANARATNGFTPLHVAAQSGRADAAAALLAAAADPNARTVSGKTPLDLATERQHTEIVRLLTSRDDF